MSPGAERAGGRDETVGFLARIFGRKPTPVAPPEPTGPVVQSVFIEWKDDEGNLIAQPANLMRDEGGKMVAVVPVAPPGGLAHVRERSSAYPVEILSKRKLVGGFELKMDFLWEGRRRESRISARGQAILEGDGGKPTQAEVINVSSGGMQLFCREPLKRGSTARVKGVKTERMGLVRYCEEAPGGYRVGLQFYGDPDG